MGKRGTSKFKLGHIHVQCTHTCILVYSCSTQPGWHEACMCECCPGCVLQLFLSDVPKQKTCMQ